jgi:hypothetical protein
MESTGVYWKPVWNVLEGQFHLLPVSARHVKNVPGRKTDVKDSEWVAELLQHGLLRHFASPCPHGQVFYDRPFFDESTGKELTNWNQFLAIS